MFTTYNVACADAEAIQIIGREDLLISRESICFTTAAVKSKSGGEYRITATYHPTDCEGVYRVVCGTDFTPEISEERGYEALTKSKFHKLLAKSDFEESRFSDDYVYFGEVV